MVIEQSWTQPERFAAIFERYFAQIHQYLARRVSASATGPALAAALAGLEAGDRDVLLLVALAGLDYQEVAQALGIPYGTVCSRLNRARRRLREALGGANPAGDLSGGPHD